MVKKALAIAGAGAILLSMAGPAFGCWWCLCDLLSDDVNIRNCARVTNRVNTQASTGYNSAGGLFGGRVGTGSAGATSNVLNDVNYNVVSCECTDGDVDIHNRARVHNNVNTQASTGYNSAGMCGRVWTGGAGATSLVTNLVNTNIVGGVMP